MKTQSTTVEQGLAEYRLTQDRPLRIVHAAGRRIECLEGTAWLTAYGEHTDFMLRPGQSFVVPNDGLMLIEAAGNGVVRVRLPVETAMPHGWRGLHHRVAAVLSGCRISPTQQIVRTQLLKICTMRQQYSPRRVI